MAKITVKLPRLHPAQQACLSGAKRFTIVVAGEKWGKRTLGIEALLASERGALSTLNSKRPVAWFSPDAESLKEVRRAVVNALGDLVKRRHSSRRIELVSGVLIDFYALSDHHDVMDQFGLVVIDGARQVENLLDKWEDLIRPILQQYKGQAWILSDAYGKKNDFYRLWRAAERDPEWARFHFDSFSNPFLPEETADEADRVTEPEFRQRFGGEFLEVAIELTAEQKIVLPGETFIRWCERLEESGMKVDGKAFTLSDRPAMRFIYELIPSTVQDAFDRIDVIMKCTQVGFSVFEMLAMIYLGLRFSPAKIGMFMPAVGAATTKSSIRFMPIVRTIPEVHRLMTDTSSSSRRGGEGNVLVRTMGESRFHFLWTTGKVSTESNPMDVVSFDEVQEMAIADMEKTRERMSASSIRYTLMGSTANWPDSDIHWWYKKGTQHQFHTLCPHCGTHQVLDEHFPNCIAYDPDAPRLNEREREAGMVGEYRYRCHECEGWIDDPQQGEWIAKVPDASVRSVHFPQFLSPTITPRKIITGYHEADDMKSFHNRTLGKPYTDPSQVPVNLEMLNQCAAEGMAAGLTWKRNARGTFMGLDQMGSFIVAVIKERMPDGHQAVVHIEYIFRAPTKDDPDASPWDRCDELMAAYGVQCCVVETLPNYDSAKSFARRHDGKVFLAGYGNMDGDMLAWGDAPALSTSERRTDEELRDRFTVRLDQYKCMQVSMARFQKRMCLFPDPDGLVQEVLEKGKRRMAAVCKEYAFFHFTRTALVAEKDEEEKKFKRRVVKVGIDPHTSYANMLCDVAWARAHGTNMFILPGGEERQAVEVNEHVKSLPGMSDKLVAAATALADTCGQCQNRDPESGICGETFMRVKEETPGCIGFLRVV
jgi:hypothetical protein